jgi:hypothetical protein
MNGNSFLGKTIFFLFPDKIIDRMIFSFFKDEYEVYNLNSEIHITKVFKKFEDSILVINLSGNISDTMRIVSDIKSDPGIMHTAIYVTHENVIPESLKNIPVNGFVVHDDDLENRLKRLFDENNAIGPRRYLRLNCENKDIKLIASTADLSIGGNIIDISSRAMLCNFNDSTLNIKPGFKFERMSINLNGTAVDVEGHIYKSVEGYNENLYVMMFNVNENNQESIEAIKTFIYESFQENMKKTLSELG